MTRQKKEIVRKIQEIHMGIAVDDELGFGFVPADFYEPLYKQIYELETQLAKLSHYNSAEEMYYDTRWMNT